MVKVASKARTWFVVRRVKAGKPTNVRESNRAPSWILPLRRLNPYITTVAER